MRLLQGERQWRNHDGTVAVFLSARHFGSRFRLGVIGIIALISSTAVVLALWFKRTGERHERAFAEQMAWRIARAGELQPPS